MKTPRPVWISKPAVPSQFLTWTAWHARPIRAWGGRIIHENKYYCISLPQFEADLEVSRIAHQGIQFPVHVAPSVSSSNPNELAGIWVSNSIQHLTETYKETLANAKKTHSHNASMFNGLKSALHTYATDCHHALSLSDAAQNLFEKVVERDLPNQGMSRRRDPRGSCPALGSD